MTISKYISRFFNQYETLKIDTNHVEDGADKYGLFKSPSREFARRLDGSAVITEYYQFFAFQKSFSEAERKEDDEWLEEFTYWLDDYQVTEDYPAIDGGRTVVEIAATGSPTPMTDSDNGIMYQISLKITYEREANA